MQANGVSVVINISGDEIRSISVERGDGAPAAPAAPPPEAPLPLVAPAPVIALPPSSTADDDAADGETTKIDPDWKDRTGYDPSFLGVAVPLPKLSAKQKKISAEVPPDYLREGGDKYVFDYHHYSLAFNKRRRCAWYSACMIDGDATQSFKRGKDKWSLDPRLDDPDEDPVNQMGEELYAADSTDRGHLTRFLDVQWGATKDEAVDACNDTFHFSNCSLQLAGFNEGKSRWQGLEQFLLEQKARKEKRRMVVFTGPIFATSDPVYRNKDMDYSIRIPVAFWKICVLVPKDPARKLAATAFKLGQPDIAELPGFDETFDVAAAQLTIKQLAKLTGLDFGDLPTYDHFAETGDDSLEKVAVLEDFKDLVV